MPRPRPAPPGPEGAEVARATSLRGEVVLRTRLEDHTSVMELRVNGVFVMDDAETSSERALATRALAACDHPARVLVGGLGLGFTVAALLEDDRVRHVEVVELEGAVVGWLRDGTVPHGPAMLADPRVQVVEDDVARAVGQAAPAAYDLVLLDVDNGPAYLVHDANARVYRAPFLQQCRDVLAPGGVLVVWAANEAPALEQAVAAVFGSCEVVRVPVQLQGRDEEYLLHLGAAR